MSNNVNTTGADVKVITVTDNDSILKSLSRVEHSLNEMMLMMEHMPMADGVNDGVKIDEAWEKQIRHAVKTSLMRHNHDLNLSLTHTQIIIDTVIAILKGHNED